MTDPAIIGVDIDAIRDAVDALTDADITVTDIDTIDRQGDDDKVRFSLTCEADTRHADLNDWAGDDR